MRIRRNKMKKCVALIDGEVLVDDVLQAALDCNMMLDDMKKLLVKENPNHEVTFINQIDAPKYAIAVDLKASAGGGFRFIKLYEEWEPFAFAEAERKMANCGKDWYCFHVCKREKLGCAGNVWVYRPLARRYCGKQTFEGTKRENWYDLCFEISPSQMI